MVVLGPEKVNPLFVVKGPRADFGGGGDGDVVVVEDGPAGLFPVGADAVWGGGGAGVGVDEGGEGWVAGEAPFGVALCV